MQFAASSSGTFAWLGGSLAVLFTAAALAWLLVGAVLRLVRRKGILDIPNARSSHAIPTPRGGGIAIVLVTLGAVALNLAAHRMLPFAAVAWLIGGSIIGISGLIDDIHGLSVTARLGLQALSAALVLGASGGLPSLPTTAGPLDLGMTGWFLGGTAVVWSINLYNFMDGIDGLAAAQVLFVAIAGALLMHTDHGAGNAEFPLLALAGATLGFLVWNFPPAKIFMGDVGSGFLGFSIAAAALLSVRGSPLNLWTWLLLNGLFLTDATTTLVSRVLGGARVYEAHRSHVYQRLARRWRSHRTVTLAYAAINVLWFFPWAVTSVRQPAQGWICAVAALTPLVLIAYFAGAGQEDG